MALMADSPIPASPNEPPAAGRPLLPLLSGCSCGPGCGCGCQSGGPCQCGGSC